VTVPDRERLIGFLVSDAERRMAGTGVDGFMADREAIARDVKALSDANVAWLLKMYEDAPGRVW